MVSPSEETPTREPAAAPVERAPQRWHEFSAPSDRLAVLVRLAEKEVPARVETALHTLKIESQFGKSVVAAKALFEFLAAEFQAAGLFELGTARTLASAQQELFSVQPNPLKDLIGRAVLSLELGCRDGLGEARSRLASTGALDDRERRRVEIEAIREERALQRFVDSEIGTFLDSSDFARLAREHASGRGGYDIIDKILTKHPSGTNFLGVLLDEAFLAAPAARAHQQRIVDLREILDLDFKQASSALPYVLVSVGCGPAMEISSWLGPVTEAVRLGLRLCEDTWANPSAVERLEIHLVDRSPGALDFATRRISRALDLRRASPEGGGSVDQRELDADKHVIGLYKEGGTRRGKDILPARGRGPIVADFRECAGLIDYLDDESTRLLLAANLYHTKPGGLVVFTAVAPNDPFTAAREVLLKWPLITRDRAALVKLGRQLHPWCQGLLDSMRYPDTEVPKFDGVFRDDLRSMDQLLRELASDTFRPGSFAVIDGYKLPGGEEGVNQYLVVRANV